MHLNRKIVRDGGRQGGDEKKTPGAEAPGDVIGLERSRY